MLLYLNFHTIAALLNALTLGAMVFLAFIVTPVAFKMLAVDERGKFLSAIFPLYYKCLTVSSAGAGFLIFYRVEGWVLLGVATLFIIADVILRPAIEGHRAGRNAGIPDDVRAFARLHRITMVINLLQMLVCLVVFFRLAV